MLLWLCIRSVKRNFGTYALAAAGIGLAVLLVSSTLAGISASRRASLEPIRQLIGGDLAVTAADLEVVPLDGSGNLGLSDESLQPFQPAEALARLSRFRVTQTAFVPVYDNGLKRVITLCGRSVTPDLGPAPVIPMGRTLGPDDEGQPNLVRSQGSADIGNVGAVLSVRIPAYDAKSHSFDLALGTDQSLRIVGSAEPGRGLSTPYVPFSYLAEVTGSSDVVWLGVEVKDYTQLGRTAVAIRALLPGYRVLTAEQVWETIDRSAAEVRQSTAAITAMVIGLGCVTVINTFLLLTQMRRREIALMKVLGLRPSEIVAAFILEGFIVNALGACVGYIVGGLWPVLMGVMPSYSLTTLGWLMALVAGTTLASLVFPALWATRYSAMEVMRNV